MTITMFVIARSFVVTSFPYLLTRTTFVEVLSLFLLVCIKLYLNKIYNYVSYVYYTATDILMS